MRDFYGNKLNVGNRLFDLKYSKVGTITRIYDGKYDVLVEEEMFTGYVIKYLFENRNVVKYSWVVKHHPELLL